MRFCIFSPDMKAFEPAALERLPAMLKASPDGPLLLTNSRGLPPADGPHVRVTAGAATRRMRALRALVARHHLAGPLRGLSSLVSRATAADLLEGVRAADPDVVVSLDRSWASVLRTCIDRHQMPWPCVGIGDALPDRPGRWRRYDPDLLVSIVFPTYDGTRYLATALESCLTQTHRRVQLVVVDDGSGPQVADIVAGFGDPRIHYVRHETNRGLPAALNTGFAAASGQLLTWTSDDNLYAADGIEQMVRFLCTYPSVDFVYADAYEIDPDGDVVRMLWVPPPQYLAVKNRIGGCFMYRRRVYDALGDYDPGTVLAEDYDYWLRVARRFSMQRLFRPLYYYRYHPRSLTASCAREQVKQQADRVRRSHSRWWRSSRLGGPV
jgi:GT2 family glycosyltransferase